MKSALKRIILSVFLIIQLNYASANINSGLATEAVTDLRETKNINDGKHVLWLKRRRRILGKGNNVIDKEEYNGKRQELGTNRRMKSSSKSQSR